LKIIDGQKPLLYDLRMKNICGGFIFLLFLIVFPQMLLAQNFAELEKTITEEMSEKKAVGAAVALIKDGKIVFAKGFGSANAETKTPVTTETLFQIGSITKTFTTLMILEMAEQNDLNLDAPVGKYLKSLNPQLSKITLSQLLSHTGGVIDEPDEFGASDESLMKPYIFSWSDEYALLEPNQVFSYSNSGFALAGLTAQEISGKSYVDLMNERVFQPLGMKNTTFRPTVAMTYPLAVGHTVKPQEQPRVVRPLPQDTRLYPAGTFYTNLQDLSRFALAFLSAGKLEGKRVISNSVIEKMSAPRAALPSADDGTQYGYGLFMKDSRGTKQIWHDGSMTGYVAQMRFVPAQNFAVIILSNTNNAALDKTQNKAMELMLKLNAEEAPAPKAVRALPIAEMRKYTGTYVQPRRWKIEILEKNGNLYIRELGQEMVLSEIGENRFSFKFPNAAAPLEIYIQPAQNNRQGFVHQYVWAFKKID
jgi:CubicO group peptidase (beta-lactamase class C family)